MRDAIQVEESSLQITSLRTASLPIPLRFIALTLRSIAGEPYQVNSGPFCLTPVLTARSTLAQRTRRCRSTSAPLAYFERSSLCAPVHR